MGSFLRQPKGSKALFLYTHFGSLTGQGYERGNPESAAGQCSWLPARQLHKTKLATKALEFVQAEQKTNYRKVPSAKWSARIFITAASDWM